MWQWMNLNIFISKGRNDFLMKIWHVLYNFFFFILYIKFGVKCKLVYSGTSGFFFFFFLRKSFSLVLINSCINLKTTIIFFLLSRFYVLVKNFLFRILCFVGKKKVFFEKFRESCLKENELIFGRQSDIGKECKLINFWNTYPNKWFLWFKWPKSCNEIIFFGLWETRQVWNPIDFRL